MMLRIAVVALCMTAFSLTPAFTQDERVKPNDPKEIAAIAKLRLASPPEADASLPNRPVVGVDFYATPIDEQTIAVLMELTRLKNLRGHGITFPAGTIKSLKAHPTLDAMFLINVQDTAFVQELPGGPRLKTLALWQTPVKDAGLKAIAKLNTLESLTLDYTGCTADGMKTVAGMKGLKSLVLIRPTNSAEPPPGLTQLAALSDLESLELECNVTDADLEKLSRLSKLMSLGFEGTELTKGLASLKTMSGLKSLSIRSGTTSAAIAVVKDLKELTTLEMRHIHGPPTAAGFQAVGSLAKLEVLVLGGEAVTDAALEPLGKLTTLKELDLRNSEVTDAGLKNLVSMKALKDVMLGSTKVTSAGLVALRKALPDAKVSDEPGYPRR